MSIRVRDCGIEKEGERMGDESGRPVKPYCLQRELEEWDVDIHGKDRYLTVYTGDEESTDGPSGDEASDEEDADEGELWDHESDDDWNDNYNDNVVPALDDPREAVNMKNRPAAIAIIGASIIEMETYVRLHAWPKHAKRELDIFKETLERYKDGRTIQERKMVKAMRERVKVLERHWYQRLEVERKIAEGGAKTDWRKWRIRFNPMQKSIRNCMNHSMRL